MKELLYAWIKDIAFYTLLMTVVLHVLPEKGQRKYLQFFMGIVLIILVISPALNFMGLDRQLDEAYTRQTFDQELERFREQQEEIEARYQRHLEEKLQEVQEEQTEEAGEGANSPPRKGESVEIPEIQIEIERPGED